MLSWNLRQNDQPCPPSELVRQESTDDGRGFELLRREREGLLIGIVALQDLTIPGLFVPRVVIPTEQNLVHNPRAASFAELVHFQTSVRPSSI